MSAPRDALFYVDLDAMAQRVGAKSEDLLFVWTSETGLDPTTGHAPVGDPCQVCGRPAKAHQQVSRTISTMMVYTAVPAFGRDIWNRFPSMSAREQLPYIERLVYAPAHKAIGRSFRNTFEVYLANAAPGLLRSDGNYNPATVMYEGSNYPDNWPMDNMPAGANAAKADGVNLTSPRGTYEYAKTLIDRGVLKGYVSLGDLANFGKRLLHGGPVFDQAVSYLHNVRANVAAGLAPSVDAPMSENLQWKPAAFAGGAGPGSSSGYAPDFDAFPSGAPLDTRVATPSKARKDIPRSANVPSKGLSLPAVAVGGGIAVGLAWLLTRR